MEPNEIQAILSLINQFVRADTWPKSQQIVTDNPQLLSNAVEQVFNLLIEANKDKQAKRLLRQHQQLLSQCRTEGIEVAFAQHVSPDTPSELATILQKLRQPCDIRAMSQRIALCQQALTYVSKATNQQLWVELQVKLGNSHAQNPLDERADNVEKAIECYQQALQVLTQQAMPVKWASTMINLANAYCDRIQGARTNNLEQAIDCYQQALQAIIQQKKHVNWATTMNNLATAYSERILGARADNLEQAIDRYQQALQVRTQQAMPVDWATTMNNLGNAYCYRILGLRADNLERSIDCYQQALQVRTQQAMPVDWAKTMNNLANAYSDRILGSRADNLERSIDCYQQVLQVTTQQAMPVEWAQTMNNLATAYLFRILGAQADNLEQAIDCCQQALQVRTQQAMPADWAQTMNNLATAYLHRIRGAQADNLEQAIDCYQQALPVRTFEAMPVDWAQTMNNLAIAYQNRIRGARADNLEQAIDCFQQALQVRQPDTLPHDHRQTQRNLGHLHFNENHWQAAQTAYTAALQTTEMLFTVEEGTAEGRQTELAENQDLAARAGYCFAKFECFEEAVITVEHGRTRAFSETYNTTLLNLASEKDRQTFADLNQQVKALEQALHTTGQEHTPPKEAVLADLKLVRKQLSAVVEKIRQAVPDFLPSGLDFQSVRRLVHRLKQPLVYLLTTSKGSLALVVQPQSMKIEVVWLDDFTEAGLDDLLYDREDGTARYLHGTVLANYQALQQLLTETVLPQLSQQLLNPLATRLQALGYSQAVLIPMDTLNLLPLQACTDFTFSFAPSARLLQAALNKTEPYAEAPLSWLGIGNPTAQGQVSLDYGPVEVASIAALFPNTQQLCENAATRDAVLSALSDKTHIHFSCHGLFNPMEPADSGLYLADTDRLTVADLILGTVDLTKTQMVVLAACQTGITDFRKAPNEVIGFSGAFMQAGVPAIISTLWPVEEISTMLLLQRFYQIYRQHNQPPACALQQAQHWLRDATAKTLMDFCQQVAESLPADKQFTYEFLADYYELKAPDSQPYAHPYYWAGFVFSGVGVQC